MLEVLDINMVYPNGYEALKRVSFSVCEGEIVGLIGPIRLRQINTPAMY